MAMANETITKPRTGAELPQRLHHNAYVCADQERTRHFYEDILGLPLIATWIERHDPLSLAPPRRSEVVSHRAPLRRVFVPIPHYLVHAAPVHDAGQVAHMLVEVAKERRTWLRQYRVVARHAADVAVQRLHHSEDELRHATKSPPQALSE
jgi:catechol 2,3-dioxygenase-like lactoylglutathione lyase family enzyme